MAFAMHLPSKLIAFAFPLLAIKKHGICYAFAIKTDSICHVNSMAFAIFLP